MKHMYDKASLESMKLPELKEIAKKAGLKKVETLKKQDLIARILETQGAKATRETKSPSVQHSITFLGVEYP